MTKKEFTNLLDAKILKFERKIQAEKENKTTYARATLYKKAVWAYTQFIEELKTMKEQVKNYE